MSNLFFMQLALILSYFLLLFPQLLRLSTSRAAQFRWLIIVLLGIKSLAGLNFLAGQTTLGWQELAISQNGFMIFSALFFVPAFILREKWPSRFRSWQPLILLIVLVPTLILGGTSANKGFPITDHGPDLVQDPPGEPSTMEVLDFSILNILPYLYEDIFFLMDISFRYGDEVFHRKNWPVRINPTRNTEPLLQARVVAQGEKGFLPGFYQPVFIMETRDFIVFRGEYPERTNYNREVQQNLNTFMGW